MSVCIETCGTVTRAQTLVTCCVSENMLLEHLFVVAIGSCVCVGEVLVIPAKASVFVTMGTVPHTWGPWLGRREEKAEGA